MDSIISALSATIGCFSLLLGMHTKNSTRRRLVLIFTGVSLLMAAVIIFINIPK